MTLVRGTTPVEDLPKTTALLTSTTEQALGKETRALRGRRGAWELHIGNRNVSLGRSGTLLLSRMAEQAALGGASVLLAWRLGVKGFAPVSALLILNSLAVVASDYGLGLDLIRRPVGALGRAPLRIVRAINLGLMAVGVAVSVVTTGNLRVVALGVGLVWITSAEAFIRKSALLRLDRVSRAARAEIVGSIVLSAAVVVSLFEPSCACAVIVVGLTSKHAIEALMCRGWQDVLSNSSGNTWGIAVWACGVLTYASGNIDFLIVGLLFSSSVFSIYSLAFRIASMLVAQVSYVVGRVSLVDFGEARLAGGLTGAYRRRSTQMLVVGIVGGVCTAAMAPIVPILLGSGWRPIVGVILVLCAVLPWRMTIGVVGMLLHAISRSAALMRWEAARFFLLAGTLLGLGLIGFRAFLFGNAVAAIIAGVLYERGAERKTAVGKYRLVAALAPLGVALCAIPAVLLSLPR